LSELDREEELRHDIVVFSIAMNSQKVSRTLPVHGSIHHHERKFRYLGRSIAFALMYRRANGTFFEGVNRDSPFRGEGFAP
jgi:hypothetical protein